METPDRTAWNHDTDDDTFTILPTSSNPLGALPAGAYELGMGMGGAIANRVKLKDEELISFENGPCKEILEEIYKFWSIQDKYEKIGVPYRRGILMYGVPGTGKSGIVRMVCDRVIAKDGLVVLVKRPHMFTEWLPILDKLEPNRRLVAVLEDVDDLYDSDEHEFLQMLDGIGNHRDGMVFLATTNFLKSIPERIYRPSRFDLLIEVGAPEEAVRQEYIAGLCDRFNVPYRKDIVDASEGLSFAHMKEILISCLLYERDVDHMVQRMREHGNIQDEKEEDD